jgi:predicted ribosome quality control (RQC) complex YloA/Tae2 family protein
LKGARIAAADHIDSDRIIKLELTRAGVTTWMWIRLWNNAANIILTETDGTIIDAFYRRPRRGEITGGSYTGGTRPGGRSDARREYEVRDFPGDGGINKRVEAYYFGNEMQTEAARLQDRGSKRLARLEARLIASIDKTRANISGEEEIENLKRTGDLLMSNLHNIVPGQRMAELDDYYNNGERVAMQLDPSVSPEINAQRYYERARKRKRRLNLAKDELASLERDLADVKKNIDMLDAEKDPENLARLLGTIDGDDRKTGVSREERTPGLTFYSGSFTVHVGRTAKENDALLRHHVRGNDYWLHSRDTPGAYVFIRSIKGKSVPLEVLLDAGNLALHYSKAKSSGKADLFYTQVKYLRRAKDGKPGLVIPTQEKNLTVTLSEDRIQRLLRSS